MAIHISQKPAVFFNISDLKATKNKLKNISFGGSVDIPAILADIPDRGDDIMVNTNIALPKGFLL